MKLEARRLGFGYRGKRVGSDLSVAVEAGEVLCLLGPNGSGKTTLFKTLLGLLPAQGGAVLIDGVELATRARSEVARLVSYVPQAHAAFFPFTAASRLAFAEPGRSGCCWLACGAQPDSQMMSNVARMRPSASAKRSA